MPLTICCDCEYIGQGATPDEIWDDVARHEATCLERLRIESNVVNITTKKVKVKRRTLYSYKEKGE